MDEFGVNPAAEGPLEPPAPQQKGGDGEPSESTAAAHDASAFRAAEKSYQLHMEQEMRWRKGRMRGAGLVERPTDLSAVLDAASLPCNDGGARHGTAGASRVRLTQPPGLARLAGSDEDGDDGNDNDDHLCDAVTFERHPGLVWLPQLLPRRLQRSLAAAALLQWPDPPARSNHDAAMRGGAPAGLFDAAQRGWRLEHAVDDDDGAGGDDAEGRYAPPRHATLPQQQQHWAPDGAGPAADALLRRLRWVSLGPPFDWTARAYEWGAPHRPLPDALRALSRACANLAASVLVGVDDAAAADAVARFAPDAALVNYYRPGDTLGGHVDDAEHDLTAPLVSVSLGGADAVFLIGGRSRADAPTPLLLRGGDVLVLAGDARRCFHGVPRVLKWGGSGGGEETASSGVERHLRETRINVSVRSVK